MTTNFRIELLAGQHRREAFDCGVAPLNRYLREQASQDVRRKVAACHVAVPVADQAIAGFYTLSAGSVLLTDIPEELGRKLPRYPVVPVVRLGRLAVDKAFQGMGLGGALVIDALARCLQSGIGAYALLVDAKDQAAIGFYQQLGFLPLTADARRLFLPMATAKALMEK